MRLKGAALLLLGALTSISAQEDTTIPVVSTTPAADISTVNESTETDDGLWDGFSGMFQRIIIFSSSDSEDPQSQELSKSSPPSSTNTDLSARVKELETSYMLLSASYSDNVNSYIKSCGSDIAKLCKSGDSGSKLTQFWSFCSGNSDMQCLLNHQSQVSSQCILGLSRYQNWLNLHDQSLYFAGDNSSFFIFFYVMLGLIILTGCCKVCCRCCKRAAAIRRQRLAEIQEECDEETHERIPTVTALERASIKPSSVIVQATLVQEAEYQK